VLASNLFLDLVIILLLIEKVDSIAAEVAGIAKYLLAKIAKIGNLELLFFQNSSGFV
jgi:hypothetical protein